MKCFCLVSLCILTLMIFCCSPASAQGWQWNPQPDGFHAGPPSGQQSPLTTLPSAPWQNSNPCDNDSGLMGIWPEAATLLRANFFEFPPQPAPTSGLNPVDFGFIVYDANSGVCWLADANLAGNPEIRALLGVPNINPDGTMDYPTAVLWVAALNNFAGHGFLGHKNWQLPDNPPMDPTCSAANGGNFGISCTGSAMGNLYQVGLARTFPDSVVRQFTNIVWPLRNLQPGLYWTSDQGAKDSGQQTLSFNTDISGSNTTKFNYFHVLPMVAGALGPIATPPAGCGVLPYTSGDAAGKAVYDSCTNISWTLDANLAATENFGIIGNTSIPRDSSVPPGPPLNPPLIDVDGTMLLATALVVNPLPAPPTNGPWLAAMNENNYAGSNNWQMPALSDLQNLFTDLGLQPGDPRLESQWFVGPFWHLQPYFYWACEPMNPNANAQAPCDYALSSSSGMGSLGIPLEYSFNFDNGFEGTDLAGLVVPGQDTHSKQFYVMVYYPASTPAP